MNIESFILAFSAITSNAQNQEIIKVNENLFSYDSYALYKKDIEENVKHNKQKTNQSTKEYPVSKDVYEIKEYSKIAKNRSKAPEIQKTYNYSFNDMARVLAGFNKNEEFIDYNSYINNGWSHYEDTFNKISIWQKTELSKYIEPTECIFYPFGGPDIAHALLLFPKASIYVLVGQEATGNKENFEKCAINSNSLAMIKDSMKSFFTKGYFVTSEMYDISKPRAYGVLPIAALMISRLGYEIVNIDDVYINQFGEIIKTYKDTYAKVIKIDFKKPDEPYVKTFYYVKCCLSDKSKKLDGLLSYLSKEKIYSFIKSSSYSLHRHEFKKLKNFILNKSYSILQDDSGIKYKNIDKNKFETKIFGTYTKPTLPVFKIFYQKELASAYSKKIDSPLDFNIGYICESHLRNKNFDNINLQLFILKRLD